MEFPDRTLFDSLLDAQALPPLIRVQDDSEPSTLDAPCAVLRTELATLPVETLSQNARVAVAVGSRGIHRLDDYVEALVSFLQHAGVDPVIVPAMGSHGGATPDGQRELLASLGVTPENVGAPIDARMETELVTESSVGATPYPIHVAKAALEADAVVVLNRVKPHTNFSGRVESGLCKMVVAGLGKQRGAKSFHSVAIERGYVPTLEAGFEAIRDSLSLLGGIAIVENAAEETAHIEAVLSDEFLEREPALLERAYEAMPTLPVDDVDLLVVDELGKEISGAGMDTNVIGRYRVLNTDDPDRPKIKLIYVRGLTAATAGNGNGIGLADLTRGAAVSDLDLSKTYANALTSGSLAKAKLPVVAPDDQRAFDVALSALGSPAPERVRLVWIRNTQDLSELYVSPAVVDDLPESMRVLETVSLTFADGTRTFETA